MLDAEILLIPLTMSFTLTCFLLFHWFSRKQIITISSSSKDDFAKGAIASRKLINLSVIFNSIYVNKFKELFIVKLTIIYTMKITINYKLFFVVLNTLTTLLLCNSSVAETGNTDQLSLSCLFKWKELPQNVLQVKISPEIQDSPIYPFKNPKEFYGDLPNNCLSKLKIKEKKLRILMDGDKLMKMTILLKGDNEPALLKNFEQKEQNRIDRQFMESGIAFSSLNVQLDKVYEFEYSLELYDEGKFMEQLSFSNNEMAQFE
jgi:hypothetical protein